jgi:hypothetical protein
MTLSRKKSFVLLEVNEVTSLFIISILNALQNISVLLARRLVRMAQVTKDMERLCIVLFAI